MASLLPSQPRRRLAPLGRLVALGLVVCLAAWLAGVMPALADERGQQLEQDIEEIKQRVKETNISLEGLATEKTTLQEAVASLDNQVSQLQGIIADTRAEIARLTAEISELQVEIVHRTEILAKLLVVLYQSSGASAIELIITADSFSDYLDNQEYLSRLKAGVADSVTKIQALESQLQEDRAEQAKALEDLQAQEVALEATLWEKQQLLAETLNQEQRFQEYLAKLQSEQEELEKSLQEHLAELLASQASLGPVAAGEVIGRNGNTGWSTGPHLHIAIYDNETGRRYDPLDFIRDRSLVWPMGGGGGWVSQGFISDRHEALDIANREGVPIRSIAAGRMIYRGCRHVGTRFATFAVVIDHGDYSSYSIHLQAPDNPRYADCNVNLYRNYGIPSIDYSVKQ